MRFLQSAAASVWLGARSLLWAGLLPGFFAGYLPWRFYGLGGFRPDVGDPIHVIGLLVIAAGATLLATCIWEFAHSGLGTLAPLDPPRVLVVRGLYRYVRNPMYLAVTAIVLGEALLTRSQALFLYWVAWFAWVNLVVLVYEEPALRRRFGASYDAYTARVGRWLPKAGSCLGFVLLVATAFGSSNPVSAQRGLVAGPRMPFEDIGACPFEGCTYRDWIANAPVTVRTERRADAPIAFTLGKGDYVRAITGIVITVRPGRVQFRRAVDLVTTAGPLHIEPGETLYLLTYHGEGATTAWFKGRLYDEVDGSEFFNGLCDDRPGTCNGTILERPKKIWWVRLRSRRGLSGWTSEPEKFDNKDRFG